MPRFGNMQILIDISRYFRIILVEDYFVYRLGQSFWGNYCGFLVTACYYSCLWIFRMGSCLDKEAPRIIPRCIRSYYEYGFWKCFGITSEISRGRLRTSQRAFQTLCLVNCFGNTTHMKTAFVTKHNWHQRNSRKREIWWQKFLPHTRSDV